MKICNYNFGVVIFLLVINILCLAQPEKPHHIVLFKTECKDLKKDSVYFFENDTLRITYNLWNQGGQMCFSIYNKFTKPIFCDWGYSMLYPHTEHSSENYPYSQQTEARYEMIPPNASVDVCSGNPIINQCTLAKAKMDTDVSSHLFQSTLYLAKEVSDKSKSIFSFRNFVTLSFDREFKSAFYLDHTFDVKKIIEMPISTFGDTKKDFYEQKTSFYNLLTYWDSFESKRKEFKNYKKTATSESPY